MLCSADTRRQTQPQSKTSGSGPEFENESQCIKLDSCIPKKKVERMHAKAALRFLQVKVNQNRERLFKK